MLLVQTKENNSEVYGKQRKENIIAKNSKDKSENE